MAAAAAALPPDVAPGDVSIHLGATTADARLDASADWILERVLRASAFRFENGWARTISGDEEGAYGWLAANYLKAAYYGALDLGGGSARISCPVDDGDSRYERDDAFPLRVGRAEYLLYSRGYPHYGADEARGRHDARFASEGGVNPCYPTGYANPDDDASGSSDWDACFDGVAALFDRLPGLRGGPVRAVLDVPAPPPDADARQRRTYVATSAFVFVWDFLGLETGAGTEDLDALKERAGQICGLTHERQAEQYDATMEDKPPARKTNEAFAQCFNAAYAYHLLSAGYGMPTADTPIEVHYEIDGGEVNWALGMMLVEANNLDRRSGRGGGGNAHLGDRAVKSTTVLFVCSIILLGVLFRRLNGSETVKDFLCRKTLKWKR